MEDSKLSYVRYRSPDEIVQKTFNELSKTHN